MKRLADPERLLDDVLEENADFRAASLDALLREARRHQHARRRNRALLVAAVVVAVAGATAARWRTGQPGQVARGGGTPAPAQSSLSFVQSEPLPASMLVETRSASVTVIRSTPSAVAQLETPRDTPFLREIGDGELFTLLAGRPAALVRHESGQAELLLLNAADRGGFPVQ
jgi:hypothetical protein